MIVRRLEQMFTEYCMMCDLDCCFKSWMRRECTIYMTVRHDTTLTFFSEESCDAKGNVHRTQWHLQSGIAWVTHRTKEARQGVCALLHGWRPKVLFLEMDDERMHYLHLDASYEMENRRRFELFRAQPNRPMKEVEEEIFQEIVVDYRDRYMVNGLLEFSKHSSSILAIVGNDHLLGMK